MFLIVAVVLLLLLPSPWDVVGFVGGLVVFLGELVFWNGKVRDRRKDVGPQTLIGRSATVVTGCRPEGQVRVDGEIWAARCETGADAGETVRVVSRDGLMLRVERVAAGDVRPPAAGG